MRARQDYGDRMRGIMFQIVRAINHIENHSFVADSDNGPFGAPVIVLDTREPPNRQPTETENVRLDQSAYRLNHEFQQTIGL